MSSVKRHRAPLDLVASGREKRLNHKALGAVFSAFLVTFAIAANALPVSAYTPQTGDHFGYSETITVNNGQG